VFVVWLALSLLFPFLVCLDFGSKFLDLLVLVGVCFILLPLLVDAFEEAETGGEGSNDSGNKSGNDKGFLEIFLAQRLLASRKINTTDKVSAHLLNHVRVVHLVEEALR